MRGNCNLSITYLYLKHDGQTEIVDKEPPRIGQQRLLSTYLFLKQDRHRNFRYRTTQDWSTMTIINSAFWATSLKVPRQQITYMYKTKIDILLADSFLSKQHFTSKLSNNCFLLFSQKHSFLIVALNMHRILITLTLNGN